MNHTFDQMMKAMGFTRVMAEDANERAAIREFDGLQSRDEAEREALAEIRRKVDMDKKVNK